MKTIGLLGGMSFESTAEYYRLINELVRERMKGLNSAKIILYSFNFAEIEELQRAGNWEEAGRVLTKAGQGIERGGADLILLCTNTMHKVATAVKKGTTVPFIHIGEAAADKILADGYKKAGLLGTKYTMEEDFYRVPLGDKGIEVIIPVTHDREDVNDVIFKELCMGIVREESKARFLGIIKDLEEKGADCIILGCTEIGMLIKQEDCKLPIYDTTKIHCDAAVEYALKGA